MADVVIRAAELRVAALPIYDRFVESLRKLEDRLKTDLVAADIGSFQVTQGKVQLMSQLCRQLENAVKLRDDMARRK